MKLIIVESYQKTKLLQSYFNKDKIISCNGHIIDLDPKTLSINIKKNKYTPTYKYLNKYKSNFIKKLIKEKHKYEEIILASDNDIEGEFIAYSLKEYLKLNNYNRIFFHSLSKEDITNAMSKKNKINPLIVESQQTRRMIDRLIGYKIQNILGKYFSIGRNQAILLKIINEKCEKHQKLKTIYKITITNKKKQKKYLEFDSPISPQKKITIMKKYTNIIYEYPNNLHSTSSIQILAFQKFKIDAFITTKILNNLYNKGFITYIRTDAQVVNPSFINYYVSKFKSKYDIDYNTVKKMKYSYAKSTKPHEAIRPVNLEPKKLSGDERKIYDLIYFTTIEYFLKPIQIETTFVDCKIDNEIKKIKIDEKIIENGYNIIRKDRKITEPFSIEKMSIEKCEKKLIPLDSLFTKASLINEMKSKKIATPSTYDYSIRQLLQKRYIQIKNNTIVITSKGQFLLKFTLKYFPKFLKLSFIQKMYENIDSIQSKKINFNDVIAEVDNYINIQLSKIPTKYSLTQKWIQKKN